MEQTNYKKLLCNHNHEVKLVVIKLKYLPLSVAIAWINETSIFAQISNHLVLFIFQTKYQINLFNINNECNGRNTDISIMCQWNLPICLLFN